MKQTAIRCVVAWSLIGLALLSAAGCGGGTSMAEMRKRAIRRPPEEDEQPTQTIPETKKQSKTKEDDAKPDQQGVEPPRESVAIPNESQVEPRVDDTRNGTKTEVPPDAPSAIEPESPTASTAEVKPARSGVDRDKEATIENLERIGEALVAYVRTHRRYPLATAGGLSWRVDLLPFLGKKKLYDQFRHDEAWDSSHNRSLLNQMPDVYRSPGRAAGTTNYLMVTGKGCVHNSAKAVFKEDIEGVAVAIVEVSDDAAAPWTQDNEFALRKYGLTETLGAVSTRGAFVVLNNGEVRWLLRDTRDDAIYGLFAALGSSPSVLQEAEAAFNIPEEEAVAPAAAVLSTVNPKTSSEVAHSPTEAAPIEGSRGINPSKPTIHELARSMRTGFSQVASDKLPPQPKGLELKKAQKLLSELFREEYVDADSRGAKVKLAKKMLKRLPELGGDLPGQFALLEIVKRIAVTEADVALAMEAAEEMASRFDFGDEDVAVETLTSLGRTAGAGGGHKQLVDKAQEYYSGLINEKRYSLAEEVSQVAVAATSKLTDKELRDKWKHLHLRAEAARKLHLEANISLKTLEEDSNDGQASTIVGKYLCFVEEDWENGVAVLANGNDRSLKRLADLELEQSSDSEERLKLADRWWKEAETATAAEEPIMRKRAAYWYTQALPGLPAGLVRLRAERRIEEVEEEQKKLAAR